MTGKQLRKLRIIRATSTARAAKEVGVSRRTWVRYEASRTVPPTVSKLIALLWK